MINTEDKEFNNWYNSLYTEREYLLKFLNDKNITDSPTDFICVVDRINEIENTINSRFVKIYYCLFSQIRKRKTSTEYRNTQIIRKTIHVKQNQKFNFPSYLNFYDSRDIVNFHKIGNLNKESKK